MAKPGNPAPISPRESASGRGAESAVATIGLISELMRLTPRAIRHYEERGLVRPARDAVNRRVYSAGDRMRLRLIALLRRGGVAIEDISALLSQLGQRDPQTLAADLLRTQRERLTLQVTAVNDALRELESLPRI